MGNSVNSPIEALRKFHHYYGDDFLVECPTGSGIRLTAALRATGPSQPVGCSGSIGRGSPDRTWP